MRTFSFTKDELCVEIAGKSYVIDARNVKAVERLTKATEQMGEGKSDKERLKESFKLCALVLRDYLGDAAYEEVFADRRDDILGHIELCNYILNAVGEHINAENEARYNPIRG